ncbi:MAG: O-methyltransferase [Actinobacteria bacterium]|nr:O-methyltransferase [Actinomycetota bacterium]
MSGFVADEIQAYIDRLVRRPVEGETVLREMEQRAQGRPAEGGKPAVRRFPIIGAEVGAILEILARSRGARRVFEVGSGFGYSAYFFARGVGPQGEVHLTDFEQENLGAARDYLGRAGFKTRFVFHAGDAMQSLRGELAKGPFDVYLVDADKHRYPLYWQTIRPMLRPGDLVIADNLLWSGAVADPEDEDADTVGLRRFAELASKDDGVRFTLLPVRDGVGVALKL